MIRPIALCAVMALSGCTCGGPSTQRPTVPTASSGHFPRFHALVNATLQGEVETARFLAADLRPSDLPEVDDDGGAAEKIGGGLGFLQTASTPEDAVDGLAAVVSGCGSCHAAAGVGGKRMGPWTHPTAGLRLSLGAVFPPAEAPPRTDPVLSAAREAWDDAGESDEDRLGAALATCVGCHGKQAD